MPSPRSGSIPHHACRLRGSPATKLGTRPPPERGLELDSESALLIPAFGGRRPETRIGAHRALSFASTLGCSRTAPLRRREAAGALGLSALQVRVTPPEGVTGGGAAGRSWSRPRHRRGARVRGAHGRGAGALSAAAVRGAAGGGPPGGPAETAAVH
ncbi:unnamed protein product [Rangifer tarandus platyrhynchus]|uniref:Uncharacterized protein n=2 Tax=Rangifer tarandus platyrhynchus TaxID=3082113 RepID=A0ACB0FHS4_RANTA|nr:unnamed protein product [Rangifer tarandus platyrhynchus]CAI9712643.1 unnamed protein product [Rangifer tarandus platyrhynchus]